MKKNVSSREISFVRDRRSEQDLMQDWELQNFVACVKDAFLQDLP